MDNNKNKIYEMLRDMWIDQGPSAGGWGINKGYFEKYDPSTSNDRSMALNLNTGKQTELKKGGKVKAKKYVSGGAVKKMAKGGSTASKRADGCATKGKTRGRMI
jgi:hypothetical protein